MEEKVSISGEKKNVAKIHLKDYTLKDREGPQFTIGISERFPKKGMNWS